jgi:sensor histidine kinase YesM
MVKIKFLLIGVLIVIIGIVVAIAVFPSEEKRVKKQFNLLSEWVSKSPEENPFTMLQRMKNIGTLFDAHCELKVPDQFLSGSYTREEISTYAGSARSHVSQLDLKFYDLQIVFPEKGVAKITLTARLTGKSTAGEQMDEIRELECRLKKIEKKWLFSQIEVIEVLKK